MKTIPSLGLIHSEDFQNHLVPESHPESPRRLAAIHEALHRSEIIKNVGLLEPRLASFEEISSMHCQDYLGELERMSNNCSTKNGLIALDEDTFMGPKSYQTAKLAAGSGLVAIDSVLQKDFLRTFVIVRPPGHHALKDKPLGFCLFNNIAIAAKYAQKQYGLKKIMIIDWDVHHGNGTQDLFYNDASILFVSFHQFPFWPPNIGWYSEIGDNEGKGYNINIPLPAGTGDQGYLAAWDAILSPICLEYKPELILLSAGYDAHEADPLGQQQISTKGYFLLSNRLLNLSETLNCPIVGFLEGGYNIRSLSDSVVATLKVLNSNNELDSNNIEAFPGIYGGEVGQSTKDRNNDLVLERICDLRNYFSKYWSSLR